MTHPVATRTVILILGDIFTLALVTAFGFASHGTLGSAGMRMLSTFIPILIAWVLLAIPHNAFKLEIANQFRELWRPFWAMVLAAPLAAFLRGLWLGTPILPVFVLVLGGVSALAILIWRAIYLGLVSRIGRIDG
jgi:hypothetical protein